MIELEASNRYRLDLDPEELQVIAMAAGMVVSEGVSAARILVHNTLADLYTRALDGEVAVALPVERPAEPDEYPDDWPANWPEQEPEEGEPARQELQA